MGHNLKTAPTSSGRMPLEKGEILEGECVEIEARDRGQNDHEPFRYELEHKIWDDPK